MHGSGTKLAIIQNNPPPFDAPARLLDITRLIRRAGRVLTGVDRVEMAYLRQLLAEDIALFGLARTPFGYVLLDQQGLTTLERRLSGAAKPSSPDFLSWIQRGLSRAEKCAQADLRKLSIARCLPRKLPQILARHVPQGAAYLNVGHSNLTVRVFEAVKSGLQGQIAVMVHDVIPLDFPQYQRDGTVENFRQKMQRVRAHADLILYNSADTQARTQAHMSQWGAVPAGIVSHLGTDLPAPNPDFERPERPYFVTVGTIEPRKNHEFLLDLWDEMGALAPALHICGGRGWKNEAVFARLDALDGQGPVFERSGLTDADLSALVAGASGVLFPSHAEGFGLPPIEAAALGVPVIAAPLGVIRETLKDIPIYASVSDRYLWIKAIKKLAETDPTARDHRPFNPNTWNDHFKGVLRLT